MRYLLALIICLFPTPAFAEYICEVSAGSYHFEDEDLYIIDENYIDNISLAKLITYTENKYSNCGNWCLSLAEKNAANIGFDYLWDEVEELDGKKMRAPCGGEIRCGEVLAENVRCSIDKMDCEVMFWTGSPYMYSKTLATYELECRGDRDCGKEGLNSKECCIIISVNK